MFRPRMARKIPRIPPDPAWGAGIPAGADLYDPALDSTKLAAGRFTAAPRVNQEVRSE